MASLRILAFDDEGRQIQFDTWLDDLQLYLLNNSRDSVSLFDLASGSAPAPLATAESATRSQWLTRDAAARLAIRNHLPLAECAHFGQHRTAQALYDAVVSRYSSPATTALGSLLLPYLLPELFATVEDLVSHLCASDARYRAALPGDFLDKNLPPMYITLYFIVTRLPDSLRSVRDHFLSLDPTSLTVDLLEQHLLAGETSAVAVGAARGTPHTPFFEGCSPSPLDTSYASAGAVDVLSSEDVGATSASAKCRSSKGKGGRGGGGGSGSGGGGRSGGGGGGGSGGNGGGSGGVGPAAEAAMGVAVVVAVPVVAVGLELSVEVLEEASGSGSSVGARPLRPSSFTCGKAHTQHRCFSRLDDARRAEFGDEVERPHWAELIRSGVAIFDLDYDAILSAMCALSASAEGDCYRCVPPDPGIEVAALGASESVLPGTTPAEALHTFTLDSGASRSFFRDSTTFTPLPAPVPVRLADPSGGPVVARSSTVLPCPAVPSGSLSCLHLPSFSTNLVAPPCSCRLLSHQTLLWHNRLGHPSLPRLRGMHSRLLGSGLPRSLPPLPPSLAPPCLPCVEGRQRAAPHSSSFPPTTTPLQTLHMGVWGPARVSGQVRERYFLLVVDDYTRYTTVFPLRSKVQVVDVLIPWIRTVRLQLRKRFRTDHPILRLHSDRGGEFSSDLLRDFCRGEGILRSFTLPDSPQQNGIAERRNGLVMEVARTSRIHAAAPHFLWPFAVRFSAHQLNIWPRVSFPETSPTLRWTGKVGDVSVFWVWVSPALIRDTFADKLSGRAIPYVFLGFPPDAPGWHFYHPTSRRVFPSQDPLWVWPASPLPAPSPYTEKSGGLTERRESASRPVLPVRTACRVPRSRPPPVPGTHATALRPSFVPLRVPLPAPPASSHLEVPDPDSDHARAASPTDSVRVRWLMPAMLACLYFIMLFLALDLCEDLGSIWGWHAEDIASFVPSSPMSSFQNLLVNLGSLSEMSVAGMPWMVMMRSKKRRSVASAVAVALILTDSRLLSTAFTDPSFESSAGSALVAELLDFPVACRLDYATALVAEAESASPPSVGDKCALSTDVIEDRHEDFECLIAAVPRFASMLLALEGDPDAPDIPTPRSYSEAITCPYSSQWQATMDAEMASWKSTGTCVDKVSPPGANIVNGMWIFRVKRLTGSPPAFKARYVA
ncbi:unnamed protein product [Closterium sp. NIES-54]